MTGGAFSATFDTSTLIVAGSPYTITYAYPGDANLAAVTDTSHSLTVTEAQPAFSGLSSANILYGTATTTLSGSISLVPNGETVSVILDGVTQTATVTGGTFSSIFNTAPLGVAGSPYTITYSYAGDANLSAVSDTSQTVTVTQATPAFSNLSSATIAYGTATTTLSGSISMVPNGETVSITVNGTVQTATVTGGAFSANFSTSMFGVAGSPYTISYQYAGDANLAAVTDTSQHLTVTKSTPAFAGLSSPAIAYGTATTTLSGAISLVPDGETVAITLDGVTQTATVSGGAFSSTFATATLAPAGSPYTITYAYAGDANLNAASNTSQTLTVSIATPVFSSLSGPTIAYGTATTTLSGTISLVPAGESVSITLDGVTQPATVSGGAFSSVFNTSALSVAGSPYTITYSYAGDIDLNPATDTSQTLTVTQATPVFSNLSSPTITYGTGITFLSGSISLVPNGESVTIVFNGATESATVTGGNFLAAFDTSTLNVAGSPYAITYVYAGDANLNGAIDTTHALTVVQTVPVFSNLSSPTITYGTGITFLSGSISLVPDGETVSVTLNGITQTAQVTGGSFLTAFDTSTLPISGSPYTITYAYGGDANLTAVTERVTP